MGLQPIGVTLGEITLYLIVCFLPADYFESVNAHNAK
jgi:hypothetical protein